MALKQKTRLSETRMALGQIKKGSVDVREFISNPSAKTYTCSAEKITLRLEVLHQSA